jgi:hypothetical protein
VSLYSLIGANAAVEPVPIAPAAPSPTAGPPKVEVYSYGRVGVGTRGLDRLRRAIQKAAPAPIKPSITSPPTAPPTIAAMWEVDEGVLLLPLAVLVPVLVELVEAPSAEPDADARLTLSGSAAAELVGCGSTFPLPTMTAVPLLGTPLTTTKTNAGPGWKRFAFGGACETWSVMLESLFTV